MILYKYLASDRVDVLANRMIRFTQPAAFNDPFECSPAFGDLVSKKFLEAALEHEDCERQALDHLAKQGLTGPAAAKMFRRLRPAAQADAIAQLLAMVPQLRIIFAFKWAEQMNAHLGLLCLSELRDSVLMWGHYTDCHQGFVVGFDAAHPFFSKRRSATDECGFLRRVVYQRERPELRFDAVSETVSVDMFQTKSSEWAYEKEWRIMRFLPAATKRIEQHPHDICLFEFEPDAVKELIVGMRAEDSLVREIRRVAALLPGASLFAAHEHPSEYALAIKELR
jgi:hypothetical protein